ncbi:MAG: hypothetical protein QG579_444 [Patescibacteria group bacterium]|nr:hypothetical protein [Patescibacteria group bacterium]
MRLEKFFLKRVLLYVVYVYLLSSVCGYLTQHMLGKVHIDADIFKIMQLKWSLLFYLPCWAFLEEVMFRFLPFLIIFLPKYEFSGKQIFSIVVLSSCIFGYMHGDYRAIFIQGVAGAYFSLIFWRYSFRLKNWRGMMNGLVASTIVHLLCNSFIFLLLFVGQWLRDDLYR